MSSGRPIGTKLRDWLLADMERPEGPLGRAHQTHAWWKVMCLTGVDYFSTLGYQPGIAFLAAGFLSPIATFILVLVTLFAALPVYWKVAERSPNGQGSISMLQQLLPGWTGKSLVLCLLGFAATDFIITMTLSAADATAHIIENPFTPLWSHNRIGVTLALLAILGGVFLKGFKEAIGLAVFLVAVYLALNAVVVSVCLWDVFEHPQTFANWQTKLWQQHGNPFVMLGVAALLFPKLALGLSGFETGVAVMPLVQGGEGDDAHAGDDEAHPVGRIRNTRKLLLTSALIMSGFLMCSSVITAFLIEPAQFQKGGEASGRALAYLAHRQLGETFGTAYDISTILILWFAGSSAMAGLLNLVPRYLPRYGMGPEWAAASRPLVLVFSAIAFLVTILFEADVDAQGGAYATGVLVLMTSAAVAVTISVWHTGLRLPFVVIAIVFIYTTVANMIERPEGIKIASFFIGLLVFMSILFRAVRSTELRITKVLFDDAANEILASDLDQLIRILPHRPGTRSQQEYDAKDKYARTLHGISPEEQLLFIEIEQTDASEFDAALHVTGETIGRHQILRAKSPAIPNAIAALLLYISERTAQLPHVYFGWTEGNPIAYVFRFLFLGEGDVAPITREVLRKAVPDPAKRPYVHVG